ncbi:LamG domain-containing protein [Paenibacillus ferrarius]|uniref:LamG domain-containing protein n=1 Tax=Paenibacillus ferrarius TaxID=1469647 RepID=UPI003D28C67C
MMGKHTLQQILGTPGLVSVWDFQEEAGAVRVAQGPHPYVLREGGGPIAREEGGALGPYAARFRFGDWLWVPRAECPALNFHSEQSDLTVLAWMKREANDYPHCQAVAGMWDETDGKRQYCLFLNLRIWDSYEQVGGHVSNVGGPTEGFKYCMSSALGATEVSREEWHVTGFTYDGKQAVAYLDGVLDARETYNPYPFAGGLYDGGPSGSDFTVGGVHRSNEMGNFYTGLLGGLAVFNRALSAEEIAALSK